MFLFINEEAGLKAIAHGVIPKADTVKYFVVLNGIPEDRVEVDYHEDGTGSFVAILNDDWEYAAMRFAFAKSKEEAAKLLNL